MRDDFQNRSVNASLRPGADQATPTIRFPETLCGASLDQAERLYESAVAFVERGADMVNSGIRRFALTIGAAAALLAGCGESQQQIGQIAPQQLQADVASTPLPGGALSQRASRPLARYPRRSDALLYLADDSSGAVDIFPLKKPNSGRSARSQTA